MRQQDLRVHPVLHLYRLRLVSLLGVLTLIGAAGCGSDNGNHTQAASPTPTLVPTSTPSPSPTATPTEGEPEHSENLFGSTAPGGGALVVDAAASVDVSLSQCIGGSGDNCAGGTAIYVGTDPGFKEYTDESGETLYPLIDGIPVSLEVTAIDPGVALIFEGGLSLTAVGQSAPLCPPEPSAACTTPGIHADLQWQLTVPGSDTQPRNVSFKLTTTSSAYTESAVYTAALTPSE
jgi:hypothetical protein